MAQYESTTPILDQKIRIVDKAICRHITELSTSPRGTVSQDVLAQLRNFVECIMVKFYANGRNMKLNYQHICDAIKYAASKGNLNVLHRFHNYLQIVASHYTLDEENSERLMLKYYEYLFQIKALLKSQFSFDVLSNLSDFPLKTDKTQQEYYEKIVEKTLLFNHRPVNKAEKYYIHKIKPFFIDECIYYEVTFTPANDYANKSDRVIAFTNLEIRSNYAVRLALDNESICILDRTMPIVLITGWEVAIRDCEYRNFSKLIRGETVTIRRTEQQSIAQYLTQTRFNLVELVDFSDEVYNAARTQITKRSTSITFLDDLDRCREIIKNKRPGANILRYLLYHMSNKIIKDQTQSIPNNKLSKLYLKNGCIPFDTMPFIHFPIEHIPKLGDLFDFISAVGREHEILARLIKNNTEVKGNLFTSVNEIKGFSDIDALVEKHNDTLWTGHKEDCKLVIENRHIFINGYKNDTCFILEKLKCLAVNGVQNYSQSVTAWLNGSSTGVDCDEKKNILTHMFDKSHVAIIYGSAGTGKSTLINHISHFFSVRKKLFLAQTNPAVDNLKRRVTASNCTFMTITKFNRRQNIPTDYDLLGRV